MSKEDFRDEKCTWSPTWRTMDKISWSPIQKFRETMNLKKKFSMTNSKIDKHHQVILLNWKSSRHIILNQILPSFRPTKYAIHNMVHSHFTLCLRAHDYIKHLSQHPWYGLWMRVKGPHHYKVTVLGSCVKWPLEFLRYYLQEILEETFPIYDVGIHCI